MVLDKPAILACYGLGSCIGLFLFDRFRKIAGGAHIMLPGQSPSNGHFADYLYSSEAISTMLQAMVEKGSKINELRAKLVGGANLLSGDCEVTRIGQENVLAVKNQLLRRNIYLAAEDVGGRLSRTARFNTLTGEVYVSSTGQRYVI